MESNWVNIENRAQNGSVSQSDGSWVRGKHGYYNLNHFVLLVVEQVKDISYRGKGEEWNVGGRTVTGGSYIIKSYKKKENAYKYLNELMEKKLCLIKKMKY